MQNKHLPMKLSPDEDLFLRHWMYDEAHYERGQGPAKRLQLEYRVAPADLALLIAAAIPDLGAQESAAHGPAPAGSPKWPWTEEALRARLAEARSVNVLTRTAP
jgi:hypothetical protein